MRHFSGDNLEGRHDNAAPNLRTTWKTHRRLDLLELLLWGSQRNKLVGAIHLDGGRVRWGPVSHPLQQETEQGLFSGVFVLFREEKTETQNEDKCVQLFCSKSLIFSRFCGSFNISLLFQQIWSKDFFSLPVSWCSGAKHLIPTVAMQPKTEP
jgi:hypothetical protein